MAGAEGDGMIRRCDDRDGTWIRALPRAGGSAPRCGQVAVMRTRGRDVDDSLVAPRVADQRVSSANLGWELKTPGLFEHAVKCVREEDVAESIICGPDVRRHAEGIQRFLDAGYDHVYVHQVGPDQDSFFRFYEERVLPEFADGSR